MHVALELAVKNGIVSRNVCSVHRPPRVEQVEIEILTGAQIAEVRAKLAGHVLLPIVEIALATGMRRGEILGLQWGDVNLDAGTLRVERSVEETRQGLRLKAPKSKRGRRNITLSSSAITVLKEHRRAQLQTRIAIGLGKPHDEAPVFSTIEGELLSPDNLSRDWGRARRRFGLPAVSFHALRHTHASILLRSGTDVLTVSRRLGHGKPSVTLDTYGHLIEGADAAAAEAIEKALKSRRG